MTDQVLEDDVVVRDDARPEPGSLATRLNARREQLERDDTITIDLPGYEGILAAEYRAVGWQKIRKITARHDKLRDEALQELYGAADTLIYACEEIHEILGEGRQRPTGEKWTDMARRAGFKLPDDATQRQALLALFVVDSRVMGHYREWERWVQGSRADTDEELVRDFSTTG